MNTHSHLLTLRQLLARTGGCLKVPAYQRRYVWGRPRPGGAVHSAQFLAECISEMLASGEPLFLNGITLTGAGAGCEIVDGQQRLTFLSLLLLRLRRAHPDVPQLRIGYECRPGAQAWMDAAADGREHAPADSQDAALFAMTVRTIDDMWLDIDGWNAARVDAILDGISVLCIEIADASHAVPAFKMMNGTKLPMQPADVIKADMMRRAAGEDGDTDAAGFNPMRWRYALEWGEWDVWWNRADVREYYKHCLADDEPPISLLVKLCLRPADAGVAEPLSYEEFRRTVAADPAGKRHAGKALYDLLRHTQKRIEDAYEDAGRYCRLKAIMLLQEPEEVSRFLHCFFVDCTVSADELDRYYKLSFLSMTITDIEAGVPAAPKFDELLATLSMADIYHTENKREAFNLLLRLNIDEDIKLGRKFDFSIWNNRSLEHIFSKSRVWHIDSDGRVVDGNDTPLRISPEKARKDPRLLCRDSIVTADGLQLSEHCIGNLVLLYGQNNAAFGNSGFESKKMMFLAPGDIGAFRSRNLLHSVCVFAANDWDAAQIVENYNLTLKNLKLYYGFK